MAAPFCTGCGKTVDQLSEYNDENPVQEDGTYANGKFVCSKCYCKLITLRLDIGSPEILQQRATLKHVRNVK